MVFYEVAMTHGTSLFTNMTELKYKVSVNKKKALSLDTENSISKDATIRGELGFPLCM